MKTSYDGSWLVTLLYTFGIEHVWRGRCSIESLKLIMIPCQFNVLLSLFLMFPSISENRISRMHALRELLYSDIHSIYLPMYSPYMYVSARRECKGKVLMRETSDLIASFLSRSHSLLYFSPSHTNIQSFYLLHAWNVTDGNVKSARRILGFCIAS